MDNSLSLKMKDYELRYRNEQLQLPKQRRLGEITEEFYQYRHRESLLEFYAAKRDDVGGNEITDELIKQFFADWSIERDASIANPLSHSAQFLVATKKFESSMMKYGILNRLPSDKETLVWVNKALGVETSVLGDKKLMCEKATVVAKDYIDWLLNNFA